MAQYIIALHRNNVQLNEENRRKSIKKEAKLDLDKVQKRIKEILRHEIEFETKQ
jgi:hypothetical protein